MPDGEVYKQQLEQAVTTIFTCRSIIRFNSPLDEGQKQDLLSEIDTSLKFLQLRLIANALGENELPSLSPHHDSDSGEAKPAAREKLSDQHSLEALYKLYHAYLGSMQAQTTSSALHSMTKRFDKIMTAMKEIQESQAYLDSPYPPILDEYLKNLKGYTAEIYYIFMEFFRLISVILQANDIHIDTEELPPTRALSSCQDTQSFSSAALDTLHQVYETHQRLNHKKCGLPSRISDTIALLAYLKESLGWELQKHDSLYVRLNTIPLLLNELFSLLGAYERAVAPFFEEPE